MGDTDERGGIDDARTGTPPAGFGVAAGLLAVAFAGATTAGVLDSVGPYLLGVSALVGVLFLLGRR